MSSRATDLLCAAGLLAATACGLSGASTAAYLLQAARGELGILWRARPLDEAARDLRTPPEVRRLLAAVPAIKAFGRAQGLTPTGSYDRYADLERPAAAWVVEACAPLAFEPRRWRFPFVGSVPYLGFFDESAARGRAAALEADGADVRVRPASAFSTLGWFADPVLSTMLRRGPEALGALANVVLHESVHATVYVKDQSAFDESLATFVADGLTAAWLAGAVGEDSPEAKAWARAQARDRATAARLVRAHEALHALYRAGGGEAEKRAAKAVLLDEARRDLGWEGPLNNAVLVGYRTYDASGPAFQRLWAACGSWASLLAAVSTLRGRDFERPQQEDPSRVLDALADRICGRVAGPSPLDEVRGSGPG